MCKTLSMKNIKLTIKLLKKMKKKKRELIQPAISKELVQMRSDKFADLIDALFLAIDEADAKTRKSIFRKIITNFLESYSSISGLTVKRKSQDINHYFKTSEEVQVRLDDNLYASIGDMLEFFSESRDKVRDIEAFMKPAISGLVSMYVVLVVSDNEGVTRCKNLVKELTNWQSDLPNRITHRYLCKGEKYPGHLDEIVQKYQF